MATQFSVFGPLSDDDEELVLPAPGTANEFSQATQVDGSLTQALTEPVQVKAPGKLNRLRRAQAGDVSTQMSPPKKVNPFRVMKEALNEEQTAKARKAFLDDRAIESDDEYAGLGGASDDDAEETAAMAKELDGMIDHEAKDLDSAGQAELAAMYAAKERELDAQLVTNLMNDINNGGLRKKRGAGLLDMDDSEDEEEEAARYKARLEQRRAQMLESQNLASLESNPKMQPFIAAMEDRDSQIKSLINIDGEDDLFPSMIEGTQVTNQPQGQIEQDAQAEEESQQTQADTFAIPMAGPAKRSRKSARDVRQVLSFLKDDVEGMSEDDGDDMATSRMVDPSFVPGLTRERSSMSIDDRSKTPSLMRGDSLCSSDGAWRDPRTVGLSSARSTESMYAMLSKSRSTGSSSSNAAVEVGMAVTVVSHGVQQLASRKASRSVNYMRVMKDQKQAQSKPKPPREGKRKSSVISLFK
jgi:mediator of replication checkpoint protein 1